MLNLETSGSSNNAPPSNSSTKQNYYYNNDEDTNEFYKHNKYPYFLLCKSCFWCCTSLYFNKSKRIAKCPCRDEVDNDIVTMHIFSDKKKTYTNNSLSNQFDDRLLLNKEYIVYVNCETKGAL